MYSRSNEFGIFVLSLSLSLLFYSVNTSITRTSHDRSKIRAPRDSKKEAVAQYRISFPFLPLFLLSPRYSLYHCVAIRHATSPPLRIYGGGRWNRDIETGNETLSADEGDTKRRGGWRFLWRCL